MTSGRTTDSDPNSRVVFSHVDCARVSMVTSDPEGNEVLELPYHALPHHMSVEPALQPVTRKHASQSPALPVSTVFQWA
jgi:hypothetical protein